VEYDNEENGKDKDNKQEKYENDVISYCKSAPN